MSTVTQGKNIDVVKKVRMTALIKFRVFWKKMHNVVACDQHAQPLTCLSIPDPFYLSLYSCLPFLLRACKKFHVLPQFP